MTSSKSTVSYQNYDDKCQDGNLSQHANELVIVETHCGAERVLLTNCDRHTANGLLTRMNSYGQGSGGSMLAGTGIFLFATTYKQSLLPNGKRRPVSAGYGSQGMKLTL
jgi:hypothetical protein